MGRRVGGAGKRRALAGEPALALQPSRLSCPASPGTCAQGTGMQEVGMQEKKSLAA